MDKRKIQRLKNSIYAYITGKFIEGKMEWDIGIVNDHLDDCDYR